MRICIIGGGPTGSFLAYRLAKDFQVDIFDSGPEIGKPVQCSGLVTQTIRKIDRIFQSKDFERTIENKIKKVRLFSKNEKCEISLKEPDLVLNRERFDKWLSTSAQKNGAKLHLNSKFLRFERKNGQIIAYIKQKEGIKKIKTDILIGADGFFSQVSKNLNNSKEFIPCVQADMTYKGMPETMNIFFSAKYKGLFAWIVPKNAKVAEIGLGCKNNPSEKFKEFLHEQKINGRLLRYTGGPISIYSSSLTISANKVFLAGEAASFIKSSTLGGIIPSLISAKVLTNSLVNGHSYEKAIKNLKKEMQVHHLARKMLDNFSDLDYDFFLKACNTPKIKALLASYSRDEYSRKSFILKLFMAQPLLAKFLIKGLV